MTDGRIGVHDGDRLNGLKRQPVKPLPRIGRGVASPLFLFLDKAVPPCYPVSNQGWAARRRPPPATGGTRHVKRRSGRSWPQRSNHGPISRGPEPASESGRDTAGKEGRERLSFFFLYSESLGILRGRRYHKDALKGESRAADSLFSGLGVSKRRTLTRSSFLFPLDGSGIRAIIRSQPSQRRTAPWRPKRSGDIWSGRGQLPLFFGSETYAPLLSA